jgi:hypothetical protein
VKPAGVESAKLRVRTFYRAPDLTLAAVGAVFVYIHRAGFAAENVEVMKQHEGAFARERGRPIPILSILEVKGSDLIRFSKEAREAAVELTRATAPHVRCCAIVFDRGGFVASAVRSAVTTMNLLAKPGYPLRVFGGMTPALMWIATKLDDASRAEFDTTAIAAAVDALRSEDVSSKPPDHQP